MLHGPSFWFDTRIYLAVTAALLIVVAYYNHYFAVLGLIILLALYLYGRERYVEQQKALDVYLDSMSQNINHAAYYALQNLPLAIALVDKQGDLHWVNSIFDEWFAEDPEKSIFSSLPEFPLAELWGKSGQQHIKAGEKYYQVIYKTIIEEQEEQPFLLIYLTDITIYEDKRKQAFGAMPVLVHIQIDNYDDVLHGLTEKQRTAVLSEVNKRLVEWASTLDGFLKKYAEDLYLAVFNRRALDKAMQEKFDILDKIRAIHAGNKIPVTLSIGIAADEPSTGALGQRAQAGLDLALGRGGDQVTVHVDGKVQFYGGKGKSVEKNTRVKARIVAQAIRETIAGADMVLAMGHAGEDFDALGAALGVARMARHLGKAAHVIVSQPGISIDKLKELLLDYEEYRDLFVTPNEALNLLAHQTLLFVVDTHRPELTAAPGLLKMVDRTIVIDHHRRAENFIESPFLVYLEPSASSTSELVTELLNYFDDKLELTRMEASALYAGILVDTKNFAVQTGVRTFEAASYLRRAGADPTIVRHLFKVDFDTIRARAEIMSHTEMLPEGIVLAICPRGIKNIQVVAAQAADMLLRIEGVRMCFVLFTLEDSVGISARSIEELNVQLIMEQLGGGGHQNVAGAQVKDLAIEEVKRKVIELSVNYIRESVQNESNFTTRS